ncbi:MAG: beta-galactosidase trimerization domain-containing protein [Puniceicoccaceae bacterium]|nr:beta-galactosidase trimerization domain-containing protein [Puniceicoccaceae bacterium]MBL6912663.1 beta-galactosidase trimerization domain-containing protein [Puniceicoccaceae bacterium]
MQVSSQRIGKRQVHLDFHTSEHLPGVGTRFSKQQFQQALRLGRLDAINLFAKGHHSWSYYPTKIGQMHPNLDFDLLGAQIEACHEIGVLAPIYYTFGWSSNDVETHPDWCVRHRDGTPVTSEPWPADVTAETPKPGFQWKFLCANTGYHDHIMAQVEELCQNYPVDGFWFDIYQVHRLCFCEACRQEMVSRGVDLADDEAVGAFNAQVMKRHCQNLRELIAKFHPHATVFFNGTTAIEHGLNFRHEMYAHNTVQDLEDLPTVWGGYDKLPLQSKHFLRAGYPITAMSGKFHTAWGEFGGFKHPNALRYEAASMIAWGANCNFGDQLHPCGEMDVATYKNIGEAYAYVAKVEDYGVGGIPVARVGLWRSLNETHDEGMAKMLLEAHVNFDVANCSKDFAEFEVVLIPSVACLTEADAERLNTFAKNGGSLVVMGAGALNRERTRMLLDVGADYLGEATYDVDYSLVDASLAEALVETPFLNFKAALRVTPHEDSEVLARIREPYFSRSYEKYTSHQNTPYQLEDAPHPAIIRKGRVIYIAHELDEMYYKHGARLHRDLFVNVLKLVNHHPMVTTKLPSAGRISLLHQPQSQRYVAHLLYGPPIQRGECEVIEDLPELREVPLTVDFPEAIQRVFLLPDEVELPLNDVDGKLAVTIPAFSCHCAVVFEY